jgi:hypothetical protein
MLALIALFGGFYALVRFGGFNPEELFPKSEKKAEFVGTASPEKLQQLHDSLENRYFAIHKETDERSLKTLKETQKYLWDRMELAKNAISKAEAPKDIKEEESDLLDSLIKGISITAAILLTIIIFLIIKITRRAKEVERVTERLKNLQTEPSPPPLGGMDPTMFSTRFRQAPLPQPKPFETVPAPTISAPTTAVPTVAAPTIAVPTISAPTAIGSEPPKMRKTAKQRVTEAVKRMVEALDSLRKDSPPRTQAVAVDKLTRTNVRVPSPNLTKSSPIPADETNYDRRGREKKQILDYAKQGRTPSEIAKWLGLPRDQVETVIRLARERGE